MQCVVGERCRRGELVEPVAEPEPAVVVGPAVDGRLGHEHVPEHVPEHVHAAQRCSEAVDGVVYHSPDG